MFLTQIKKNKYNFIKLIKIYKFLITKKYFYRNGHNKIFINWYLLYEKIKNFYLLFKFKYNPQKNTLQTQVITKNEKFMLNMSFFKQYLKLINQYKWYQLDNKILFNRLKQLRIYFYQFLIKIHKK